MARNFGLPRGRGLAVIAISGAEGAGEQSRGRALREALGWLVYEAPVERHPLSGRRAVVGVWAAAHGPTCAAGSLLVAPSADPTEAVAANCSASGAPASRTSVISRGILDAEGKGFFPHPGWGCGGRDRRVAAGRGAGGRRWCGQARSQTVASLRVQSRLVGSLPRRVARASRLDVPAGVALSRKHGGWGDEELVRETLLQRPTAGPLGVRRLAGAPPTGELATEIGRAGAEALAC